MRKIALLTLLSVGLIISATAQEEAESSTEPAATVDEQAETDAAEGAEDTGDDSVVDDEFYQDVEDEDFRPSEDIPADQSIPFPTDI